MRIVCLTIDSHDPAALAEFWNAALRWGGVAATPDGYQELGRFTPPQQPERSGRMKAWAYPAIADGKLYLRDQGALWCYDVSAAAGDK